MTVPDIVRLLERKDERIEALQREVTELREEGKRLREGLEAALQHLEWTSWGDNYERTCAREAKLPEKLKEALKHD